MVSGGAGESQEVSSHHRHVWSLSKELFQLLLPLNSPLLLVCGQLIFVIVVPLGSLQVNLPVAFHVLGQSALPLLRSPAVSPDHGRVVGAASVGRASKVGLEICDVGGLILFRFWSA